MGVKTFYGTCSNCLINQLRQNKLVGPLDSTTDSQQAIYSPCRGSEVCVISTKQSVKFPLLNDDCLHSTLYESAEYPAGPRNIGDPSVVLQPSFRAPNNKGSFTKAIIKVFMECFELLR